MFDNEEEKLDKTIKDAFAVSLDKVEAPSPEEEWKKFEAKYNELLFADSGEQYLSSILDQKNLEDEQDKIIYLVKPIDKNHSAVGYSNRSKHKHFRNIAEPVFLLRFLFSLSNPKVLQL